MAFQVEKLDPTVEFGDDDNNDVEWVTGEGQWVYWRDCNITIIVKDSSGNKDTRTMCPDRSGQGQLPSGVDLYCFGGKLKVA